MYWAAVLLINTTCDLGKLVEAVMQRCAYITTPGQWQIKIRQSPPIPLWNIRAICDLKATNIPDDTGIWPRFHYIQIAFLGMMVNPDG